MPIVTVFGGSGFIGRYVAKKLAKQGWRVRCAVRRPNEAQFLRPYGDVGQVQPIQANVRDEASTLRAIRGYQRAQGLDSDTLSLSAAQQLGLVAIELDPEVVDG